MRTKLSRRLLALLLAAVFLFANVPTFGAEGDSGTGSRGDVTGDGTAASAGDGKTESSYGSGSKVTLMVANKGDYNSGYIMDFTPMSDGAWAGLNPSQVGEYPIYFINGSLTKEFTRTNESDAHDISSLIVSEGGAAFGVDNAIYNRINSAFSVDWNNAVSENYVENTLEIKHQEDIQNDEAAKKKNADTLGALLKIMAVKHPEMISDYPELQGVIDGTGGGKQDYIFLVEPLVPARREASSYSYTTILNFASMLNSTAASTDKSFFYTVQKMSGSGGWFNLKPKFIGGINPDTTNLSPIYSGGGNTIASKIYYSGPTKPDGAVEGDDSMFGGSDLDGSDGYDKTKRADASDNKWGFGVLFLGDYLTPDDDSVLQMHIMDVNLADKKAEATKVILRPDVISQRNSLTSRESVTIGEAEVRHAKTDANAYYGGLDAALKSSDFTISKKQLPTAFDGDFIRGKLTGSNVGDKLTYGAIAAGGALNREAFSVTMGMQTENKVFAPTPPDLGKSGDKYALSGYANAPKNADIAKVVPSLENSYAAIGLNHDMADEYFNRNIKTVYSGAFDLNFKPKDGVDASNLAGTTSVMLNGAAYAWWAAASEYISGQISSGNFNINYGGGTAQIVQETAGSEFIYGIRPNDSDTNFKYRKVSDTAFQTALNGLLKSSSAIKDATNETNAVAYKISESGILERNLTVTKATPADEVAKIQDAVSVLGEDVMRANSRGIITYANSGVGSFTNIEGFPEKTFGSETLDYRGYYGKLPQFVALFDAYTPVDLIVLKDGLVDEIYSDAYYADLYNVLNVPNGAGLGLSIEHAAVKPSKVGVSEFIKAFLKAENDGAASVTVGGVSVPLKAGNYSDAIKFGVNTDDITNPDRISLVVSIGKSDNDVVKVYDQTDETGVVTHLRTTKEKITPNTEYSIKNEGDFEVKERFITPQKPKDGTTSGNEESTPWDYVKNETPKQHDGEGETTIPADELDPPHTIYIHYVQETPEAQTADGGELPLTEKRITKRYKLENITTKSGQSLEPGLTDMPEILAASTVLNSTPSKHGCCTSGGCDCEDDDGNPDCNCGCNFDHWIDGHYKVSFQNSGGTDPLAVANPTSPTNIAEGSKLATLDGGTGLQGVVYGNNTAEEEYSGSSDSNPFAFYPAQYLNLDGQMKPFFNFIVYRGYDLPTVAKYSYDIDKRVGIGNSAALSGIGVTTTNTPAPKSNGANKTAATDGYLAKILFALTHNGTGNDLHLDYFATMSDCGGAANCPMNPMPETVASGSLLYNWILHVFSHKDAANQGLQANANLGNSQTTMNGVTIKHLSEGAVSDMQNIKYYPYVEMVYDTLDKTADENDMRVNVLSDNISEFHPNDYIEQGWSAAHDENDTLVVDSTQWSIHSRATSGASAWQQKNRVLPGGGIFKVSDNNSNPSVVGVTSWQTFIEEPTLTALSGESYASNYNDFKVEDKMTHHDAVIKDLVNKLEKKHMQMYVNTNFSASNPYDGGIKVGSGSSFAHPTGGTAKMSTDNKYWFQKDTSPAGRNNNGAEGDMDVITPNRKTTVTFYRMRSDVDGKIYLEKQSVTAPDAFAVASLKPNNTAWSTVVTYDKTVSSFDGANDEAKKLDDRTKIITNFFKTLNRNTGNDSSITGHTSEQDSGSPAWYNEAFRGICVAKVETTFEVGFELTDTRLSVLDPHLEPPHASTSSIFTNAYQIGIRLDDTPVPFLPFGTHGTQANTTLKEPKDVLRSKKFFVPNASVTDLQS